MKRVFKHFTSCVFLPAVLTALIAVLLIPSVSAAAVDSPNSRIDSRIHSYEYGYFKEDGIWYCISRKPANGKNGEVYASGTAGGIRKAAIPALVKHDGKKYDVAGINDWGFYDDQELESVEVEEGVKIIGQSAFSHCGNLKKVKLADSINEAGIEAFEQCGSLEEINIPDSLKEIPKNMFYECSSLKKIELGKKTVSIGEEAFKSCTALKTVRFNKALKTIGAFAFYRCSSLQAPKFTSNITTIGMEAFTYCSSLKTVKLPKKVKVIPFECFAWCESLETVKLPSSIVTIEGGAFGYCYNLKKVSGANKKLKSIGYGAFEEDTKLASISFPNIEEIDEFAFYKTGLTKINLGNKLKSIGKMAFSECPLEKLTIPGSLKSISEEVFTNCRKLKSVTISEGVERIEANVFNNCTSLTDISIPDTVHYVSANSFYYTPWLALQQGQSIVGIVGDDSDWIKCSYYVDGEYDYSRMPDSICINDVCIWINDSEVFITDQGLYRTRRKTELIFPSGVKLVNCSIGTGSEIKKVVFPEGVEEIAGNYSFGSYSNAEPIEVILPSTLKILSGNINGTALKSIELPASFEAFGKTSDGLNGGFSGAKELEKVTFKGNKLKEIGASSFSGTKNLKSIDIPEGVEKICEYAFEGSGLTKVKFPESLKTIDALAFKDTQLTSVSFPDSLKSIGSCAFEDTPLESVTFPKSVTFIDGMAFYGTNIKKLTLPDNLEFTANFIDSSDAVIFVKKKSKAYESVTEYLKRYSVPWKLKTK